MAQLGIGDTGKKIGLVFYRIDCGGEILEAIVTNHSRGIMPGGCKVKGMSPSLLEIPEFDHPVAHHIGIGCESSLDGPQRVFHHVFPIFLM